MGKIELEQHTFRSEAPFSGIATKPRPPKPYQEISSDWGPTGELVSGLGKTVEKIIVQIWASGANNKTKNSESLNRALDKVLEKTRIIKELKEDHHQALARIYQEAFAKTKGKKFGEVRFLPEDPEIKPTFEPLDNLFRELDRIYETDFSGVFESLGPDPSNEECVHPQLRYLVETAIVLAKAGREKSPFPPSWCIVPDAWIYKPKVLSDGRTKMIAFVQFDGVILADGGKQTKREDFNLLKCCQSKTPWSILEIKHNHKVPHVVGRQRGPIKQDIAFIQNKLAKIALFLPEGKKFNFPKLIVLTYLRGTMDHDIHIEHLDSFFFEEWADTLEHNLENGHFDEKTQSLIKRLIFILREKKLIEEREERTRFKKNKLKFKDSDKIIQGSFRVKQKGRR